MIIHNGEVKKHKKHTKIRKLSQSPGNLRKFNAEGSRSRFKCVF